LTNTISLTPALEDYLEVMWEIYAKGDEIRVTDIAEKFSREHFLLPVMEWLYSPGQECSCKRDSYLPQIHLLYRASYFKNNNRLIAITAMPAISP
jgi:hypothetical protein